MTTRATAAGTFTVTTDAVYMDPLKVGMQIKGSFKWSSSSQMPTTNLRWLQIVKGSYSPAPDQQGNLPATNSWFLDPWSRQDYSPLTPFFSNETENNSPTGTRRNTGSEIFFDDATSDGSYTGVQVKNPKGSSFEGVAFLVGADFVTHQVTLYDGIDWGYSAPVPRIGGGQPPVDQFIGGGTTAVPEPASIASLLLFAVPGLRKLALGRGVRAASK